MSQKQLYLFSLLLVLWLGNGCRSADRAALEPLNQQQVALGKTLYDIHCAACHGANGEGEPHWKRPDANGIYSAPPHDSSGHTWHHADQQLLQIIALGGSMPASKMPAYQDLLKPEEMEAVLTYIKTFWGQPEREFQAKVTKQWEE